MKIFVVEDSPIQAKSMARILAQRSSWEARFFADGLEALRTIYREPPDFLCLDMLIPSLHGLALCRLLKFHQDWRQIPILLMTSSHEPDLDAQVRAAGGDGWLAKPFSAQVLLDQIGSLIERTVRRPAEA